MTRTRRVNDNHCDDKRGSTLKSRLIRPGLLCLLMAALTDLPTAAQTPPAAGQPATNPPTVQLPRATPVRERPRGDSAIIGTVPAGEVLEILSVRGDWYEVAPPAATRSGSKWQRGWMQSPTAEHLTAVGGATPRVKPPASPSRRRGRMYVRGFGELGGMLFAAGDSFESILGSSFRRVYGVGGQVGFPSGAFLQVNLGRLKETGTGALVSGTQVFRLESAHSVTVTPMLFSVGYRDTRSSRIISYLGAGAGWYRLKEELLSGGQSSASSDSHAGYHILGGAEYPLTGWLAVAGEVQWSQVPGILGDTGVSAVFEEDDLGGTTFGVKLLIGR